MDLNDYLRALRNYWIGACVLLIACGFAAFLISERMPKVYAANANGFVSTGQTKAIALGSVADALARSRATSYVDVATSRATAQDVIADLHLQTSAAALASHVTVSQPPDTVLLEITAKASTPTMARDLADAWVKALAQEVKKIEAPHSRVVPNGTPRVIPVEQAALPTHPVSPDIPRNVMLGVAVGAVLALAYSAIRSNLDKRLRFSSDVESRFSVPVVGEIPISPMFRATGPMSQRARQHPRTTEAFRKLRTNLMYMDVDEPPRALVITSPRPGDGKSTIASHIATTLASMGERVVLVEADLRRPSQAARFRVDDAVGLTTVLTGQLSLADALQDVPEFPGLKILTSGPLPPNPSELLGSKAWRRVLDTLRADAYVVIDAPPLLPVTDAAVAARTADGAFVIVNSRSTLEDDMARSLKSLDKVNARMLGAIINRVPKRANPYAYAGYGYGYFGAGSSSRRLFRRRAPRRTAQVRTPVKRDA